VFRAGHGLPRANFVDTLICMNLPSHEIRRQFIDFFVHRCGHTFIPSSPVVPQDDPTLMFTNAGMNQFKPLFLGTADPNSEFGRLKRAVNSQKCIRAGGKHNDLDDVGKDTYHHTFFEMLGNWSFGDYFKKEAIGWAWELLTKQWGLDPTRLHATYFQGDEAEGLEPDVEARELWAAVPGMSPSRIHPGNKKDNFWEMGDTGPCGPCSEIHVDLTPDKSGGKLVNAGDARVMEIWNLVFIQFNRGADGKLTPLPAKHVDTGMGFERVTSLLQGKKSNYDTDVFTPIFAAIQTVTGAGDYRGTLPEPGRGRKGAGDERQTLLDVTYRVVADHIRCLTFALTDGALPSNEGRGYVLRRILRRAFRYGWQYLGMHRPFLCDLVPAVVTTMGEAFPELRRNPKHVAEVIRDEEESFGRTLERGIALFDEAANYARTHHHGRIKGEDAFKLHDTFGFPIDLTQIMAEEKGMQVDVAEYERLMEQARERARGEGGSKSGLADKLASVGSGLQRTDDSPKYETLSLESRLLAPIELDHASIGLVFDRTCFYGEQGGQVGDHGRVVAGGNAIAEIVDTQRVGDVVVHIAGRPRKPPATDAKYQLIVDASRRAPTMQNHTSTHVLNWALREVLGDHVQQKGSLVDPDKTRFDFSHPSPLTEDQIRRIEALVNEQIHEDLSVNAKEVPQKEALKINGLRAVFGEKYPEVVRVVSIGPTVDELLAEPDNSKWRKYSIEFCGGTHLQKSGEAKHFCLIEESAVAKGIRRVVGITAERAAAAEHAANELAAELDAVAKLEGATLVERYAALSTALDTRQLPLLDRTRMRGELAALQERVKQEQKQQARAGTADVISRADRLLADAVQIGSHAIIVGDMGSAGVEQLRSAIDSLRQRAGSAAVCLAAENDGKVVLLAAMTPDLVQKGVKAGDVIKEIAPIVGGRGGGKPDIAQGGGADIAKVPDALKRAVEFLRTKIG